MLYREIIAVCSQIHTKHLNTLCGQNVEFLKVECVVGKVTAGIKFSRKKELDNQRKICHQPRSFVTA